MEWDLGDKCFLWANVKTLEYCICMGKNSRYCITWLIPVFISVGVHSYMSHSRDRGRKGAAQLLLSQIPEIPRI